MTNVRRTGVFHNLHYGTASAFTISNNSITGVSNVNETKWNGISLFSLSVPSTATDNIISAAGVTQTSKGYEVWNVKSTTPAAIDGGSVSDATMGVFVNNYDGYNSDASDGAHATISGITINPISSGTGVRLYDNPSSTHANVQATLGAGVTINACTDGLVVENAAASVTAMGNVAFAGQSGDYIKLISNAANIDATTASFDGNTGGSASLPQNFAIEDKIMHKVDNISLGLVRVKAAELFVTLASGSVQRGVDAATVADVVNVNNGTFNENVALNKEVTLAGQGPANTILTPSVACSGNGLVFTAANAQAKKPEGD